MALQSVEIKEANENMKKFASEKKIELQTKLAKARVEKEKQEVFAEMEKKYKDEFEGYKKELSETLNKRFADLTTTVKEATEHNFQSTFKYGSGESDPELIQKMEDMLELPSKEQEYPELALKTQRANDVGLVVKHVSNRSLNSFKYFQKHFGDNSELAKAIDTGTAGVGLEFKPEVFSRNLIERMEQQYVLAGEFEQIVIPRNQGNLVIPGVGGGADLYIISDSSADDISKITASSPGTRNVTLSPITFGTRVEINETALEDSIIDVINQFTLPELERTGARKLEQAIIDGDTAATHQDSDVTSSADPRVAWDGLRKLAITETDLSNTATTVTDLTTLFGGMTNGTSVYNDKRLIRLLINSKTKFALMGIGDVYRVDGSGQRAAILSGELPDILGVPIIESELVRKDLNASGVYDGVIFNRTILIAFNKMGFAVGIKRDMTLESDKDITTQRRRVVMTMRMAFKSRFPSTEPVSTFLYNAP